MNHHANKVDYSAGHDQPEAVDPVFSGVLQEVHQCPACGNIELRRAAADLEHTETAPGSMGSDNGEPTARTDR